MLTITGGRELAANLSRISSRLSRRIQIESLTEAAEPMRRSMSALAPQRAPKPDLKDMFVISLSRGQDRNEAAVAIGPTRSGFYASFLEFGTKYISARPFIRPAFDRNAQVALDILASSLWRELAARGLQRTATSEGGITGGPGGSTL